MHLKLTDAQFTADISPLLATGHSWNINGAADLVSTELIKRLSGEPWKGASQTTE